MTVEFHPDAAAEFIEAARHYETRVSGLGYRFIAEFEGLKDLLLQQPKIGIQVGGQFHRVIFRKFPFSLMYSIQTNRIWIVAVAHQRKRPGYWRGRRVRVEEVRHAQGYASKPVAKGEFSAWEREQDWGSP